MPAPEWEKGGIKRICGSISILPNFLVMICHMSGPALGQDHKVASQATIIPTFMDGLAGILCLEIWWVLFARDSGR